MKLCLLKLPFVLLLGALAFTARLPAQSADPGTNTPAGTITNATAAQDTAKTADDPHRDYPEGIVQFSDDVVLGTNETAQIIVAIGGDVQIDGEVKEAVVAIGGDVVVNGRINGDLVAVGGTVKLQSGARIRGNVVLVNAEVERDPEAKVSGHVKHVPLPAIGLSHLRSISPFLNQCVFKLRPLSLGIGWIWLVVLALFLLYLLTWAALQRPVAACVRQLEQRPATTFLAGLLGVLLMPFIAGIFIVTGIGILGLPFLFAAFLIAVLVGKVAVLEYAGTQTGRLTRQAMLQRSFVAFLLGWLMVTLLCLVPVVGFLTLAATAFWGFGAAVMAVFARSRQEAPPATAQPLPGAPFAPVMPQAAVTPPGAAGIAVPVVASYVTEPIARPAHDPTGTPPTIPPAWTPTGYPAAPTLLSSPSPKPPGSTLPEALVYPRATFWQRLGAAIVDVVLIGIATGVTRSEFLGFLFLSVAYFTGMWAWRQTTVGCTIAGLKVVRLDGGVLDWKVALIRALGCWLSVLIIGLGFLWILWDAERQGWHDRIAGTVVVKLPRGTPLLLG